MSKYALKDVDVALDNYDDIFSDFDISPYNRRLLSEDFTRELMKHAVKGKKTYVLSIPKNARVKKVEGVIKRRIQTFFKEKLTELDRKIMNYKLRGTKYIIAGMILISLYYIFGSAIFPLIAEMLLVAGWFGTWTGLYRIFDEPSYYIEVHEKYNILANAKYVFVEEETLYSYQNGGLYGS